MEHLSSLRSKSQNRQLTTNIVSLIGGQLTIAIISLANSVVLTRALGAEDRGYFLIAALLPSLLMTFTDFGLGQANTKFIASTMWSASTVLISNIYLIFVRLGFVSIIGYATIHLYSEKIFPGVPQSYLYLGLLQIVSLIIQNSILPIMLGLGYGVRYSLFLVVSSALTLLIMTIWWLLIGLNVTIALLLQFISSVILSLYLVYSVQNLVGKHGRLSLSYLKEGFKFGSGIYLSIVANFINQKMILIVLNLYGGAVFVTLHSLAQALTDRLYLLADAVGTMLMPKIAEDPEVNSNIYTPLLFKLTIYSISFLSFTMMVIADWLVIVVYGDEFSESGAIIKILLFAVIFLSGWRVISQDLIAKGKTKITAFVNLTMTVISLGSSAILIPTIGLSGAAWGAVLGAILTFIFGCWIYVRESNRHSFKLKRLIFFSRNELQMIIKLCQSMILRDWKKNEN